MTNLIAVIVNQALFKFKTAISNWLPFFVTIFILLSVFVVYEFTDVTILNYPSNVEVFYKLLKYSLVAPMLYSI